jgi:hypothetical protein
MGELEQPGVGVVVDIHESGGNDLAGRVDGQAGLFSLEIADAAHAVPLDGDIGPAAGSAGAVDEFAVFDNEVVQAGFSSERAG